MPSSDSLNYVVSNTSSWRESKMNLKNHKQTHTHLLLLFLSSLRLWDVLANVTHSGSPVRTPDRKGGSLRKCMFSAEFFSSAILMIQRHKLLTLVAQIRASQVECCFQLAIYRRMHSVPQDMLNKVFECFML